MRWVSVYTPFGLSFFDCRFDVFFFNATLTDCALCLFSVARALLFRTCAVKSSEASYGVATIARMTTSPTKKTLLKVTMSMMTTMTTVLHRDLENDWSCFSLFHSSLIVFRAFPWSSRCCLPPPGLGCFSRSRPRSYLSPAAFTVQVNSTSVCVGPCACMRHSMLLIIGVALHGRSAIVLLREIQVISCYFRVFAILPIFRSVDLFAVFVNAKW